jgi:hypothetical protein
MCEYGNLHHGQAEGERGGRDERAGHYQGGQGSHRDSADG